MAFSSTHFSLSLHVLTTLTAFGADGISSRELAEGAGTNPAFLRHVLGSLREAGMIESRQGNRGGLFLATEPSEITIGDVYRVVEGTFQVATHSCPEDSPCPVATSFTDVMDSITSRIDTAITTELDQTTIADLARQAMSVQPGGS